MKKYIVLTLLVCISYTLFAFGNNEEPIKASDKVGVGLLLNSPGLVNSDLNLSTYSGLERSVNLGQITLRTLTSKDIEDSYSKIELFVTENIDLIFVVGEGNKELAINSAKKYPEVTFIAIDTVFDDSELLSNLYGTTFKEQDGGYLAGLVAGSLTQQYSENHEFLNSENRVGVITGKNIPWINRHEVGFYTGVNSVNEYSEIISININDLDNYDKGYNAVLELKEKGVDIIYTIAGKSDLGVYQAAKENNIIVIGTDMFLDLTGFEDTVLTTIRKDISISTNLILNEFLEGKLEGGGNRVFGIKDGTISLSDYVKFDKYIPVKLNDLVRKNSKKLSKGSIEFPLTKEEVIFKTVEPVVDSEAIVESSDAVEKSIEPESEKDPVVETTEP